MSFTVICNNCKETVLLEDGKNWKSEEIQVSTNVYDQQILECEKCKNKAKCDGEYII